MGKNVKRNVVLSVVTLCFLLVLLAGSTFALFSDSAEASIVVGSATVDVEAEIITTTFQTYSLEEKQSVSGNVGHFQLGGQAELLTDANGNLTGELVINHIAPGDRVEFQIAVSNLSNISILRRIRLVGTAADRDNGLLLKGLEVEINGDSYVFDEVGNTYLLSSVGDDGWETLAPNQGVEYITVSIALPTSAGNEYQGLACSFAIVIEAYQGNANQVEGWNNGTPYDN